MHEIMLVEDTTDLLRRLDGLLYGGNHAAKGCCRAPMALIVLGTPLSQESISGKETETGGLLPVLVLSPPGQHGLTTSVSNGAHGEAPAKIPGRQELLSSIERLLESALKKLSQPDHLHRFGSILVDLRRAEVRRDGRELVLSAREFKLIRYFIEHRGAALSRQELLKEVWGYRVPTYTRTVDVHIAGLRRKIEDHPKQPQFILTVKGLGYKFVG
jgi:hypothetical protein